MPNGECFIHTASCPCMLSCSVVSDSLQPCGLQPDRLLCPWDSLGNSPRVSCQALSQGIFRTQGSNPGLLIAGSFFTAEPPGEPQLSPVLWSATQTCPTLCNPWTVAHQAPQSRGFSRQEHWSGLPCPPLGDLPNSGIEPSFLASSAL